MNFALFDMESDGLQRSYYQLCRKIIRFVYVDMRQMYLLTAQKVTEMHSKHSFYRLESNFVLV